MPRLVPARNRTTPCWIESYLDYTAITGAPEIWRRWAGISFVAAALGRNCHVRLQLRPVYPNLFILLLGASGSGKSRAMVYGLQDLVPKDLINVAPNTVTWEMLVKRMGRSKSDEDTPGWMEIRIVDGEPHISSAVLVAVDEISNFIQENNPAMLDVLTALYDCPTTWQKETKSSGSDHVEGVCLNMLGGVTPEKLLKIIPDGSFKYGFTSRLIIVHSDEVNKQSLFGGESARQQELGKKLKTDLEKLTQLWGEFTFAPEVREGFDDWWMRGMNPVPNHPRLRTYNTRRHVHLAKLSLIYTASSCSGSKYIETPAMLQAIDTLLSTETGTVEGLQRLTADNGGLQIDAIHFVHSQMEKRNGAGIAEQELRAFLVDRVPAYRVKSEVEELLLSGMLTSPGGPQGYRTFKVSVTGRKLLGLAG